MSLWSFRLRLDVVEHKCVCGSKFDTICLAGIVEAMFLGTLY